MVEPASTVTVTLAAGLPVSIIGQSYLVPGTYHLTGDGITVIDNGATLSAGVSVVGGVLRLTVS